MTNPTNHRCVVCDRRSTWALPQCPECGEKGTIIHDPPAANHETGSFYRFHCKRVSAMSADCSFSDCTTEEPTMTDNNLALQLSLLAWMNMKKFLASDMDKITLTAICENNIAILKDMKDD